MKKPSRSPRPLPRSPAGGDRPAARSHSRTAPPLNPERVLARQSWASLRNLVPLAAGDPERAITTLRAYATDLLEWNRGVSNLISRHDESRLVERHLAESLAPAALLGGFDCKRLLDLGSGAGLPAIPLALVGVGESWRLVESRRNKTLFMRKALQDFKLDNIEVVCSRLETLVEEEGFEREFDGFTSRATMAVGPTLELAAPAVVAGGRAFLWKGSGFVGEMESSRATWERDWSFEAAHPILAGPNCVAVFYRK